MVAEIEESKGDKRPEPIQDKKEQTQGGCQSDWSDPESLDDNPQSQVPEEPMAAAAQQV